MKDSLTRQQLIDLYASRLSRLKWTWFGTLTFRNRSLPFWMADRIFGHWICEIQESEGTDNFRWFRVNVNGALKNNVRFHVLVGGLRFGSKWPWIVRWEEVAGDAEISYFFPSGDASKFIMETARLGSKFEIDCDLS